ncbi:MAG: hypothetical protein RL346_942 [Verrucomicrobiota bacterium]|jgi:DNA-binding LacI/PurR family transcriptional regulator
MKSIKIRTPSEQVADHLRDEILARTWIDTLPGEGWLARELAVGRDTVKAAVQHLELQGLLESQGIGRSRRIVLPKNARSQSLHVKILLYEMDDAGADYIVQLRHQLELAEHSVSYASKTLFDLRHSAAQVEKFVRENPADAWIVLAGGRSVLEWFSQSGIPAFALFGRMQSFRIAGAGPDKAPAFRELANRLVDLGHRKIVMMVREERRKPNVGRLEQLFLDELKARGISVGAYNLPDWDDTPQGFQKRLDSLFRVTPPTALFLDTSTLFYAAQHYLAHHPNQELRKVSLFCSDYHPAFEWCKPSVACFNYDIKPVIRHAVLWVNKLSLGQNHHRQLSVKVTFVDGQTISEVQ